MIDMEVRRAGLLVTLAVFVVTLFAPMAAIASVQGRRNTAIALTAAAVYSLAKRKTTQGLVLGAGAYYAWRRYNKGRQYEVRRRAYRAGYRRGYRSGNYYAKHNRGYRLARR